MKGWRKEMRPKGFLLSVNPSSSKETAKVMNGVHNGIYMYYICIIFRFLGKGVLVVKY